MKKIIEGVEEIQRLYAQVQGRLSEYGGENNILHPAFSTDLLVFTEL
jgi:hypothetical protein